MSKVIKKIALIILFITIILGMYNIVSAADDSAKSPVNLYIHCNKCDNENNIIYIEGYGKQTVKCELCGESYEFTATTSNTKMKEKTFTEKDLVERLMPARTSAGPTGLFPQYYLGTKGRIVTFDEERYDLNTKEWTVEINGEIVYCAKRGAYVRYGYFDTAEHYLYPDEVKKETVIQGQGISSEISQDPDNYIGTVQHWANNIANSYKQTIKTDIDDKNKIYSSTGTELIKKFNESTGQLEDVQESDIKVEITFSDSLKEKKDALGIVWATRRITGHYVHGTAEEQVALKFSDRNMVAAYKALQALGKELQPVSWSPDVDGENPDDIKTEYPYNIYNAYVVVLENLAKEAGYHKGDSNTYNSNEGSSEDAYRKQVKAAYILTAIENAYKYETGKCAQEYTLNDIQTAYWLYLMDEYDGKNPNSNATDKGKKLYDNSVLYYNFLKETNKLTDYNPTIDAKNVKVIADRENREYIVGPFKVNYPMYEDFSYIKALTITTDRNQTLIYGGDKNDRDFDIICQGKEISNGQEVTIPGGTHSTTNGLDDVYPKNGENFFIKFKADKVEGAQNIELGVKLEYLESAKMEYTELQTKANIYRYGFEIPETGTVKYEAKYPKAKAVYAHQDDFCQYNDGSTYEKPFVCACGESKIIYENEWVSFDNFKEEGTGTVSSNSTQIIYRVTQPCLKMEEGPKATLDAQDLIKTGKGERIYKTADITTNNIDITMELGGYVWVDKRAGKEDVINGLYDRGEEKVPNVTVILHEKDPRNISEEDSGIKKSETTTDKDGKYIFVKLDAMKTYYVQFVYNGQYYEPTYYTSPEDEINGWGKGKWQTNSNSTDIIDERLEFNKKFASIGSTPNNYGENKQTYTREELYASGIIDEYGNVKKDAPNGSMKTYALDCLMNAYTGKDNLTINKYEFDYYPTPSVFSIDDEPILDKAFLGKRVELNLEKLYPAAYYINLGLNEREEADIAVKKDVSKVTLEINGQTHEYTYDTLENKENAENTWEIGVRVSDSYYNTAYTRELYKSDYLYKASNYGNEAKQQELGKSKDDELEVYVTYKVMVRNQSLTIKTRIDEIVDYFDKDYEYVDERSYIRIANGDNTGMYKVNYKPDSMYGKTTETSIDGYDKIYIQGLGVNAQKLNDTDGNFSETKADGIYLQGGQTAYVYLTFKVKKEVVDGEEWVILDEDKLTGEIKDFGVGKENIVEINGYSTIYAEGTYIPNVNELDENGNEKQKDVGGTPAGLVDKDSTPGNLNPIDVPKDGEINYNNFEDDTDKAPNIRIRLYREDDKTRVISGSVWEDARDKSIQVTTIGDGIKTDKETLINGVTVQLVEIMENGTEFVWREFGSDKTGPISIGQGTGTGTKTTETPIINAFNLVKNYEFGENKDGRYAFKSFIPGKYVVRFIYGDTIKTVTPESLNLGGLNAKSYNGQDYKSTTYQQGVAQNNVYTWKEDSTWNNGQEIEGKTLTIVSTFKSDASNNETLNLKANQNDAWLNNKYAYLYDINATDMVKDSISDAKDIESRRKQVIDYSDNNVTNYISEVLAAHKSDYDTMTNRTQLLNDLMQNTKMTAETGLMVIEFEKAKTESDGTVTNTYHISNVDLGLEERPKAQIIMDKEVTNVKLTLADGSILFDATNTAPNVLWRHHKEYENGYKNNLMDSNKFTNIESIRTANSNKFGLVQLSMDEELMHGATIKISYKITAKNIGEVDYVDNKYYYSGVTPKDTDSKVVTTRVDKVLDYVANNLQFYAKDNPNWTVIDKAKELKPQGLVNDKLHDEVEKFNTIIITDDLAANLVPNLYKEKINENMQDSISVPLVLTQLITTENDSDDLTYKNIVEVVEISNTAGRRQEFSVVGNQNPTQEPQELDSDRAELVKILPPFGNAGIYIIIAIITILTAGILTGGILFIKKKVLKR